MVKVKICGITNSEDALVSVESGADALGFVFYKKSPRYISPKKAKEIVKLLPKSIIKIGVFVNNRQKTIKQIAKFCSLDMLQFHGAQSPEFCLRFIGYKVIKAFRIKDKINFKKVLRYKVFAYLFDTYTKSKPGGTGKKFNWKLFKHAGNFKHPVFLSGGLNQKNCIKAIRIVKPAWVDISSSVEKKPGQKDHDKIKSFIQQVKKT
ncbi:MAG: phosphoribosylanthranilate isomerase [Candidatus Omnitrophota bacterium]